MSRSKKDTSVLLIVDDESSVCRALSRMLQNKADEILTAHSALEAETILDTRMVTHLICDHWFGPIQPVGVDLVAKWKAKYSSIRKAVILTGTDISTLQTPPGIDQVMAKTVDPDDLYKALDL